MTYISQLPAHLLSLSRFLNSQEVPFAVWIFNSEMWKLICLHKCAARCDYLCMYWLVGCYGFDGPLSQYFSLYQTISQRAGERREKWLKEFKTMPACTYCKHSRPLSDLLYSLTLWAAKGKCWVISISYYILCPRYSRALTAFFPYDHKTLENLLPLHS